MFTMLLISRRPVSTLFPYTTLFRSSLYTEQRTQKIPHMTEQALMSPKEEKLNRCSTTFLQYKNMWQLVLSSRITIILKDRKSTRLNSSHVAISYAVLCLKI